MSDKLSKVLDEMMIDLGDVAADYIRRAADKHNPAKRVAKTMFYVDHEALLPVAQPLIQGIMGGDECYSMELGRLIVTYLLHSMDEAYPIDNTVSGLLSLVPEMADLVGAQLKRLSDVDRQALRQYLEV